LYIIEFPCKNSHHSEISSKRHNIYDENKKVIKNDSSGYHFIGSSFGKDSVPTLREVVKTKNLHRRQEQSIYENKVSEEVKLTDTGESDGNPHNSNEKIHPLVLETDHSYKSSEELQSI
jgi:hypothetical protein